MKIRRILTASLLTTTSTVFAQGSPQPDIRHWPQQEQAPHTQGALSALQPNPRAQSAVGTVGQRQTREEVISSGSPMARIDNRIANRVQSRVRSRIDRDHDLQASSTFPFTSAGERTRKSGRR